MTSVNLQPAGDGFSSLAVSTLETHNKNPQQAYIWGEAVPSRRELKTRYIQGLLDDNNNLWKVPRLFSKTVATLIDPHIDFGAGYQPFTSLPKGILKVGAAFYIKLLANKIPLAVEFLYEITPLGKHVVYYSRGASNQIQIVCPEIFEGDLKALESTTYLTKAKEIAFWKYFKELAPTAPLKIVIKSLNYPQTPPPLAYKNRQLTLTDVYYSIPLKTRFLSLIILTLSVALAHLVIRKFEDAP